MASRTRGRTRLRNGDSPAAEVEPGREPIPPGWPGEDPTLPDDVGTLGGRPPRSRRRAVGTTIRHDDAAVDPVGSVGPRGPLGALGSDEDAGTGGGGGRRPGPRDPHRRERGGLAYDHPHHTPARPRARDRDDLDGRVAVADRRASERLDLDRPSAEHHDADRRDVEVDPHDHELDDDELDLIAGVQPAGRVLVVMVVALVLAMLVNADALVERAERKPPGRERDRSLAIWEPVQDVSHVLQLYRVRQVADWIAGDDDEPTAAPRTDRESRQAPRTTPAAPRDETGDVAPAPGTGDRAVTLRTPTEDEPLRLLVAGDFTAQVLGDSLARASDATGVVDATVHYESASGLTRPDYFDWPAALEEDVEDHDPEVLVLVVGVNDAQGIVTADGAPAQLDDPRWGEEYHRRVGELMDQLRADDRMLVWVGQPPMRDGDFAARMSTINQVYAEQAGVRPWVTYVDPAALVGGPDGAYTDVATGPDGAAVELRQPDGIHLTAAGGDLIAGHVLGLVGDQVDLGERSGDAQDSDRAADDPAG